MTRKLFVNLMPLLAIAMVVVMPAAAQGLNVYVANHGSKNVSQYETFGPGLLKPLIPATENAESNPIDIAVTPDKKTAYVSNETACCSTISQYHFAAAGGGLSFGRLQPKNIPTVSTETEPEGIAIAPNGKHAYVATEGLPPVVAEYEIEANGSLVKLGTIEAGTEASGIAVTPNGKCAYVTNYGTNTVSQYKIEATGRLKALNPASIKTGEQPAGIAVTPNGKYAYIAVQVINKISQEKIEATCVLKDIAAPEEDFGGVRPDAVATTNTNTYVTNYESHSVEQYKINAINGKLEPLAPENVNAGGNPGGIAISPDDKNTYVTNATSNTVSQYEITPGGVLKALFPPSKPTKLEPFGIAVVKQPVITVEPVTQPHWYSEGALIAQNQPEAVSTSGSLTVHALHQKTEYPITCTVKDSEKIENPTGGGAGTDEVTEFELSGCVANPTPCKGTNLELIAQKLPWATHLIPGPPIRDVIESVDLEIKCSGVLFDTFTGTLRPTVGNSVLEFDAGSGELANRGGGKATVTGTDKLAGPPGDVNITAKTP